MYICIFWRSTAIILSRAILMTIGGLVAVYVANALTILMAIGRGTCLWLWRTVLRLDIIDKLWFCVGLFCFSAVG